MDELQLEKIEKIKQINKNVPSKKINNANIYQIQKMRKRKNKKITFEDSAVNYNNFSYHKLDLTKNY